MSCHVKGNWERSPDWDKSSAETSDKSLTNSIKNYLKKEACKLQNSWSISGSISEHPWNSRESGPRQYLEICLGFVGTFVGRFVGWFVGRLKQKCSAACHAHLSAIWPAILPWICLDQGSALNSFKPRIRLLRLTESERLPEKCWNWLSCWRVL